GGPTGTGLAGRSRPRSLRCGRRRPGIAVRPTRRLRRRFRGGGSASGLFGLSRRGPSRGGRRLCGARGAGSNLLWGRSGLGRRGRPSRDVGGGLRGGLGRDRRGLEGRVGRRTDLGRRWWWGFDLARGPAAAEATAEATKE